MKERAVAWRAVYVCEADGGGEVGSDMLTSFVGQLLVVEMSEDFEAYVGLLVYDARRRTRIPALPCQLRQWYRELASASDVFPIQSCDDATATTMTKI